MSLRILPVTAGKATSGDGFVLGHPGLVFKPVAITGTIQILFPQNRVPKLESLAVHFEGKVTFPAVPEQPSTEKAETKDKKKDDVNTDDYELVAMKRVLIELAVPVKLSDMSTDASVRPHTHHISHFKSTPSLSERPPLVLPPYASSSSVSLSSHASSSSPIHLGVPKGFGSVEVKFRFDMTAEEAADLPPAADMTPSSAEALSPKNNLVKLGVHYQLRAVARFAGTFENKEVVETVPIPWPKFHPDAVSRVIGTGERKVKRSGVSAKGFRWRWEILSGVGALGDMRPLALFLDLLSMDGKLERGVASVTVMLTETKEWLHTKVKRERSLEVGSYLEDFPGEFNDKTVTFALPLSLSLEPTIDYDPVKITHKLSILIDSASPDSLTEKLLDVRSEIPYAVAGFTRDDCDDLVAEEGNIPNEVLSQMSRQFIGKRLKDMEYIKFSAETLTRIVKDRPMEVSPTGVRPPRGGITPWTTFQNVMTALKRTRKHEGPT